MPGKTPQKAPAKVTRSPQKSDKCLQGTGSWRLQADPVGADPGSEVGTGFDAGANASIDLAAVMMNLDLIVIVDTVIGQFAATPERETSMADSAHR